MDKNIVQTQEGQQEEKIILLQLVSQNECVFMCLSLEEGNDKLDIGLLRKQEA